MKLRVYALAKKHDQFIYWMNQLGLTKSETIHVSTYFVLFGGTWEPGIFFIQVGENLDFFPPYYDRFVREAQLALEKNRHEAEMFNAFVRAAEEGNDVKGVLHDWLHERGYR